MHYCMVHNIYWETTPSRVLRGAGCKKCGYEKVSNSKYKTHQQYVKEVEKVAPNIKVIEEYTGATTPIKHYCQKHNLYWDASPSNILKGCGCVECGKEKIGDKNGKNHQQYIEELRKINSNIIAIDTYINASTPIRHRCLKDGYEWNAKPGNILFGKGCPKCANNIKKTHNEYAKEVSLKNPDIEVLEEYINVKTPILHKCKKHNIIWKVQPTSILQGFGCLECGKEKVSIINTKSHEQYVNELKKINPNIEVVGNYTNANTSILHKCLIDGYKWKARPGNILNGTGCPKCAGSITKTHEEYIHEAALINPNIKVTGRYINRTVPITHKCFIDGYEWNAAPFSILRGTGCPKCSGKLKKTHSTYVNEVLNINPDIEVVGKYITVKTPILHRCLKDGYEWNAIPSGILSGNGCPRCHESSGERQIRQWLEKHDIKYVFQKTFKDCRDKYPLPFDFYLPDNVICIEYDGGQHTKPVDHFGGIEAFERTVKHDKMKNEYCKNNGIYLLRIPYNKNVEEELNNFLFI